MSRLVSAALLADEREEEGWTFAKGQPAPPSTSTRILAAELGENLNIPDLEEKLNTVFMVLGVDDVEELKSAVGPELESALTAQGTFQALLWGGGFSLLVNALHVFLAALG